MSFFHGTHPLSEQHGKLYDELVPSYGKAQTLEGELLRAATHVNYDYYNNGMINNTSGPVRFLQQHLPQQGEEVKQALAHVYTHCNTGGFENMSEELPKSLTVILESVVNYVLGKEGKYVNSDYDMFDYEEPDADQYEEEDDYWEDDYSDY